ncbi:isopenicillin N synthase family oxygenase [Agrobacterium tumefaciens]|uniref:Isopenicillin N synthase family oxygenase n=1 Tax=Agrobacterium tumefaciens TaxID=358 RepID=A0AAP9E833_AGRTU|nr:2-oxoglutarate and iron-dependent oxygenase domain-containing protein [Agrobacterium tumefaciens]NSZ61287.1 isopenicillin N synthase family oxygenase [Agrobacterium tumefaciens]QDY96736.1 isopenicillin N synthase family oxygenase [Agrobacterium tumefaciens]UXS46980.1 isopenicillin N synthase family oxygenase [Agrobacterium tumefaciens]UXS72436.1 isopenicillin N synthase family oxygenase [Agrobacterium tumefaciens]UXS80727.1 isopenicillin N synthase family oxygenase [Agrobacterium tumefacien
MAFQIAPIENTASLPTLDFSRFHSPEARAEFIGDLRNVLHDHGFFYLTGHGVDPRLVEDVLSTSKRFFALPLEEKLKIEMVKSPHFRGYNRAGQERTRGEQDWREQLDINTEGEPVKIGPDSPPWKRLFGPNQWPDALPELKPLLLRYQAEVTRIGIDLLKAIAAALGQPENVFAEIYEPQPTQLLKIIRYPGRDVAETDQGVGAHKDGGFVTVLLQDTTPGLRVRTETGDWIDAPPVPGTFIINTGELLELATNGFVRADVHDVVAPPAGVERFSVAFFLGSRYDATIPVIELSDELKRSERGITVDPLNPIFREVGQNHLKSRLRSHPDVALAHHVDLLSPEQKPLRPA